MQSDETAGAEATESETPVGMAHLGELLQATEPQEPDTDDAGASSEAKGPQPDGKLTQFNDLAGKLNVELDDLYKLAISESEDGSPVTIEDLKDSYAKRDEFALRELEFEETSVARETELLQAQEEVRELLAALPEKAVKPEVLQKVRDKHVAKMTMEKQRTLDVIPTWQDEKQRTADIEGMAEHLKQYGFPVNYLERVADHRQVKYIRDNWQREQRMRQALSKIRAGKPNPTPSAKPAAKAPQKQPLTGVRKGSARNQLEAVLTNVKG